MTWGDSQEGAASLFLKRGTRASTGPNFSQEPRGVASGADHPSTSHRHFQLSVWLQNCMKRTKDGLLAHLSHV
jgi:hypothetical protein